MKLTIEEAWILLNNSRGLARDDYWIEHSICVGKSAGIIAKALHLDADYATTLGYIHDIGKRFDWKQSHVITGYEYIKKLGYSNEYANVCLTHSYLNNDINCVAGGTPNVNSENYNFKKEFIENYEYTIYDKIINLCDLMCTNVVNTLDKRLIDLIIRKGVHENTKYHIEESYKLKKYFDDLLGYNLYDLFPEIKENL